MARYRFLSTWLLECERQRVWEAIYDSQAWPRWWRGVEVAEPGSDGRWRYVWRSWALYPVRFEIATTRVEPGHLLEGRAEGDLEGTGRWRLFAKAGVTAVLYEWDVRTTRTWMNLVAPVARPIFESNHDWVMRNGGRGIARRLGCRLLASD